ncbi:hypothetical protein MHU86_10946 [Fragilaria crotonensis]|nr:hypothetical protein MHU86_10946 [Fragilaria crotonensis]
MSESENHDMVSTVTEPSGSIRNLTEMRQSHTISEGGSIYISSTERALSFSNNRTGTDQTTVTETYITSLIEDLQTALKALNAHPSLPLLEEWAILIHECLSVESRKFHSVHHVFEISSGCDPLQLLAAFFRDSIKSVTDGALTARQERHVGDVLQRERQQQIQGQQGEFHEVVVEDERLIELVMDIFGRHVGQSNCGNDGGLDFFLSAVLMARVLKDTLSETYLAQIAVCMEATIPFRERALETLDQRLRAVNEKYNLGLTEGELVESIQRGADLNNRNLGNFASEDAVFFLDHTWSLLPERCRALRRMYLYTVNDMCEACHKMEVFLTNLDSTLVFQSFRGVPDDEEMRFFRQRLCNNLQKGQKYMRAKLLGVAICAAIATLTGGDGPMSFFTGDLPTHNYNSDRLGEDFPIFDYKALTRGCDFDVYLILNRGRQLEQTFDTRNSPIAAYLYAVLGDAGVLEALQLCEFPMTTQSSLDLLKHLPRESVVLMATDIGKIALSRTDAIQDLMLELFGSVDGVQTEQM